MEFTNKETKIVGLRLEDLEKAFSFFDVFGIRGYMLDDKDGIRFYMHEPKIAGHTFIPFNIKPTEQFIALFCYLFGKTSAAENIAGKLTETCEMGWTLYNDKDWALMAPLCVFTPTWTIIETS